MRRHVVLVAVAVATLGLARSAAAQGFQVNEHGSCVMGRGGTGVASPCADGSAMFYNPAGMFARKGWTISGGVTGINANGGFTADISGVKTDLTNGWTPVPHFYGEWAGEKFAAGIGAFVPYGLGTTWPDTFEGKFAGYDNNLFNLYVQPTLAFRPNPKVMIGAGFDYVFGKVTLTQRADLSENVVPGLPIVATFGQLGVPYGTQFADGALDGTGHGVGFHAGLIVQPHERVSFGVKYLSRVKITYNGTVDFTPAPTGIILAGGNPFGVPAGTPLDSVVASAFVTGPLIDQNVTAKVTLPDQITAGIAVTVRPGLLLLSDFNYVFWKVFKDLPVTFDSAALSSVTVENYKDTWGIRFGFDWEANSKVALRGGYIFHTAGAPDEAVTPLLPEGKRDEFTVGIGYAITPHVRADIAYQYLMQQKRRGRTHEFPSGVTPDLSLNNGLYEFMAHLVGVTLTVGF
jgi:long-chain fatty acid transport protein